VWTGSVPLTESFQRFSISEQKKVQSEVRMREGEVWRWSFTWCRKLFEWEHENFTGLIVLTAGGAFIHGGGCLGFGSRCVW
jgi:hypothetical protein